MIYGRKPPFDRTGRRLVKPHTSALTYILAFGLAKAATNWHDGYRAAAGHLFDGIPAGELTCFAHTLDRVLDRLRGVTAAASAHARPHPASGGD